MIGWLGYLSFWTLDIESRSTYDMTPSPIPYSYIGIQPTKSDQPNKYEDRPTGTHHIAFYAKSKREVDQSLKRGEKFLESRVLKID